MDIEIRGYTFGDEYDVSRLIVKVYDRFVAPGYSLNGNAHFYDWVKPENIRTRQEQQNSMFLASEGDLLVGMIEIRGNETISLLFVLPSHHRKGIARLLFNTALAQCRMRDPNLKKFGVHASPFSVPVYEKLGFVATGPAKIEHGITYIPMANTLL